MTMNDEELAKIKKREYSRGYQAGRKKLEADEKQSERMRRQNAFYNQALLASIPACISSHGWKQGDKQITGLEERTKLAHDFAVELTNKYWRSHS